MFELDDDVPKLCSSLFDTTVLITLGCSTVHALMLHTSCSHDSAHHAQMSHAPGLRGVGQLDLRQALVELCTELQRRQGVGQLNLLQALVGKTQNRTPNVHVCKLLGSWTPSKL